MRGSLHSEPCQSCQSASHYWRWAWGNWDVTVLLWRFITHMWTLNHHTHTHTHTHTHSHSDKLSAPPDVLLHLLGANVVAVAWFLWLSSLTSQSVIVQRPDLILVWTALPTMPCSLPRLPTGAGDESGADGVFRDHDSWNNRIIGVLRLRFSEEDIRAEEVIRPRRRFSSSHLISEAGQF